MSTADFERRRALPMSYRGDDLVPAEQTGTDEGSEKDPAHLTRTEHRNPAGDTISSRGGGLSSERHTASVPSDCKPQVSTLACQ